MNVELISAVAAVGTFVVIAASAIAAILQLRHIRTGNQLGAVLTVLQLWQSPDVQGPLEYVRRQLPQKLLDPEYLRAIERGDLDREIRLAVDWHEQLGYFLKQGLIHDSFLGVYSPTGSTMWDRLSPVIKLGRDKRGESYVHFFEYFAARERAWTNRHGSAFPPNLARLPLRDPWAELRAGQDDDGR